MGLCTGPEEQSRHKLRNEDFVVTIPGHRDQELLFAASRASRLVSQLPQRLLLDLHKGFDQDQANRPILMDKSLPATFLEATSKLEQVLITVNTTKLEMAPGS